MNERKLDAMYFSILYWTLGNTHSEHIHKNILYHIIIRNVIQSKLHWIDVKLGRVKSTNNWYIVHCSKLSCSSIKSMVYLHLVQNLAWYFMLTFLFSSFISAITGGKFDTIYIRQPSAFLMHYIQLPIVWEYLMTKQRVLNKLYYAQNKNVYITYYLKDS